MNIVYYTEGPDLNHPSIFLAGPTPRTTLVKSWRPEAIRYFKEVGKDLGFFGNIIIPEARNDRGFNNLPVDFDIIRWEWNGLEWADCIMFWVPRNINGGMPAFTTNIEWGMCFKSGRVVLGYPESAERIDYMAYCASRYNIPFGATLKRTVQLAVEKANENHC